jgi:Cytochrome P450
VVPKGGAYLAGRKFEEGVIPPVPSPSRPFPSSPVSLASPSLLSTPPRARPSPWVLYFLDGDLYQTVVGINSWVAHRNKSVFGEDVDQFRPERWLVDDEQYKRMDRYFMAVRPLFPSPFPCLPPLIPIAPINLHPQSLTP